MSSSASARKSSVRVADTGGNGGAKRAERRQDDRRGTLVEVVREELVAVNLENLHHSLERRLDTCVGDRGGRHVPGLREPQALGHELVRHPLLEPLAVCERV